MYLTKLVFIAVLVFSGAKGQNREGDSCLLQKTGELGVCRVLGDCTEAIEGAVYYGIDVQVCGVVDGLEVVCCSPSSPPRSSCLRLPSSVVKVPRTFAKAGDYCINLTEKIYPCRETNHIWTRGDYCPPVPDSADVHGRIATSSEEFPHLARMGNGDANNIRWRCIGSLISERWVLTAVFCLTVPSPEVRFVGLGMGIAGTKGSAPVQVYNISRRVLHPAFNRSHSGIHNNMALAQLDRAVTFSNQVLPACLHTGTPLQNNGLILTRFDDGMDIYKWTMEKLSHAECSELLPEDAWLIGGVQNATQICARPIDFGGSRCKDYGIGGPLQVYNGDRVGCTFLLVGVGIYAPDCIALASRVAAFVPWIETVVWP